MIRTSKVGKWGGSINATIPLVIVELFDIKEGDVLKWVGIVGEGTPSLIVEKEEKESSE